MTYNATDKNIYVSETSQDTVQVINPSTNTVIKTISTAPRPKGLTFDNKTNSVFVVTQGNPALSIPARVFSLSNPSGIVLPTGSVPLEITYDAFYDLIYVTDFSTPTGHVYVIDPNSLTLLKSIQVGSRPWGMAVDPYNGYLFVAISGSNIITIINKETVLASSLATGFGPTGIVFDPAYQLLFVSETGNNRLDLFNVTGNDASLYFDFNNFRVNSPGSMTLDCTHNAVWLTQQSGKVSELGLCAGTVYVKNSIALWANLTIGGSGNDLTYGVSTNAIYVADGSASTITSYETDNLAIPAGQGCSQGIVDYGINGGQKYSYTTTAFESVTTIKSLDVGKSNAAAYNKMSSLQLNVVDYGVPTFADGIYWTQNVISLASAGATLPFNKTTSSCASPVCIQFTSEIFNFTQSGAGITYKIGSTKVLNYLCSNNGVKGQPKKSASTYYCDTPWAQGITLPVTIKLRVITGTESSGKFNGEPFISFQYFLTSGANANKWIQYDRLDFDNSISGSVVAGNPLFTVSGAHTPTGHMDDAEIVFCGYAGSASVQFSSLKANMGLYYLNAGVYTKVPHAFSSGSDTGESTTNVFVNPVGMTGTAYRGTDDTGQLY